VLKAKESPRRIVFPEGEQPRVLRAARQIVDEGIAVPILLGSQAAIQAEIDELDLGDLGSRVEVVSPRESGNYERYVTEYWHLRQRKGITQSVARRVMGRRNAFGMMMVKMGDADGLLSGLTMSYPETIRPALQIIGRKKEVSRVSGMYMMVLKNGDVRFFGDATVNIAPSSETLAEVAVQMSDTVREFGLHPRVAMISFSNFGSAPAPESVKVARAVELVRAARPDIEVDGELQADTALDYEHLKEIFPFTRLTDSANVLVFPCLSSGNVAYKLMQTLGGATAIGPILLGVQAPITVVPRNASVENIVSMAAFTVYRAQGLIGRRPVL
jgi:malate dehydrogenase (oxaloacetate-decarboxylating)(NADP+)